MNRINALINQALETSGEEAEEAVSHLVDIGMPALSPVIEAIRNYSGGSTWKLQKVLLQIRSPRIVPILLDLFGDDNFRLVQTAGEALARQADPRALGPMGNFLMDPENLVTRRLLAAKILGEIGDPTVIEDLRRLAKEIIDDPEVAPAFEPEASDPDEWYNQEPLYLLIEIIIALAKLNHHQSSPYLEMMVRPHNDYVAQAHDLRTRAAKALKHTHFSGYSSTILNTLNDEYYEVRRAVLEAAFLLGTKKIMQTLVELWQDDDQILSENALVRLGDLTGETFDFSLSQGELRQWWKENSPDFEEGVCYRLGRPIWLGKVIEELKKEHRRQKVIEELKVITGQDFGYNFYRPPEVQSQVVERAQKWWRENRKQFERGGLYKYGHRCPLSK